MKTRLIAAAFAALTAAACTQSSPPAARTAATGPCTADFVEVTAGHPQCAIALEADGALALKNSRTAPVVVSYQEGAGGQTAIPARKVILFPPAPRSGMRIIQACEDAAETGLCWAVRLLAPGHPDPTPIIAGKYGPERWIRWSPEERKVALISRNEGAQWLHIIDTATGVTTDFPGPDIQQNWQIDRDSFAWTTEDAFTAKVQTCETCAPEERNFSLP